VRLGKLYVPSTSGSARFTRLLGNLNAMVRA
jgi:hypothetical protein